MPDAHAQQVFYPEICQIGRHRGGYIFREKRNDFVVHRQLFFGHGKPDRRRRKTFAARIHGVLQIAAVRIPPAFCHHFPVPQHHKTVEFVVAFGCRFQKIEDAFGRNAFRFGRATGKARRLLRA